MIYRRTLFSPRKFKMKNEASSHTPSVWSAPCPKSEGDLGGHSTPEALLDCFAYLMSPKGEPLTLRKLTEIFDLVSLAPVRLCLRAHGQLQQLLQGLQAVENNSEARLLRVGCWHSLSCDAFCAAELLEASWESLVASIEAPEVEESLSRTPTLVCPKGVHEAGSLKRRRLQVVGGGSTGTPGFRASAGETRVLGRLQEEEALRCFRGGGEGAAFDEAVGHVGRCLGHLQTTQAANKALENLWTQFPQLLASELANLACQTLWEAFERLARCQPKSSIDGHQVLAAARRILEGFETDAQEVCLRALHAFACCESTSTACFNLEMLLFLVAKLCDEKGAASSASTRTLLGLLAHVAGRGTSSVCQDPSDPTPAQVTDQHAPSVPVVFHMESEELGAVPVAGFFVLSPEPLVDTVFASALAQSLAWYKDQLETESDSLDVEVHLNFAMGSLLMAWLARGDPVAKLTLKEHLGSTQALLDILRTFTVFQENCGSLTDASLLCLHAVMEFLSDSDGAKHLEMTPPKVRKAPPRILQPEPEAVASQKPKAQVPTAVKKEQYDEFDVVHERSKTKAPEIDNVQNEFGVVQVYHRRAKKTSLAL
ncbi:unnamed protein product [Durusdinium trenchii]|uniref:Uncharacterized protein n=1 Tax=Durusdinium trenchii TaxID=1381693 RepID=A0ABP0R5B9_9DINO